MSKLSGSLLDLETQRKGAKIGMGVSLALLTITAFDMKNGLSKKIHTISGAALLGFSLWHISLYDTKYAKFLNQKKIKRKRRANSLKISQSKGQG